MQGGWQHGMEDDVVRSMAWYGETNNGLRVKERERNVLRKEKISIK